MEFAFLMQSKLIPSLLLCHSILLGVGVDKIEDLIVVSDPTTTGDSTDISTLGTPVSVGLFSLSGFTFKKGSSSISEACSSSFLLLQTDHFFLIMNSTMMI